MTVVFPSGRNASLGALLAGCLFVAGTPYAAPENSAVIERLIQATDQWPLAQQPHVQVPMALVREVASDDISGEGLPVALSTAFEWNTDTTIENGEVQGLFRWEGQWPKNRDGVTRLRLFSTGTSLHSLALNDKPVTPIREKKEWVVYVPQGKPVVVTGTIAVPVRTKGGWNEATWPMHPATFRSVQVATESPLDVYVVGQAGRLVPNGEGKTAGRIPVNSASSMSMRWRPYEPESARAAVVQSSLSGVVVVEENQVRVTAQWAAIFSGGAGEAAHFQLPPEAREVHFGGNHVRRAQAVGDRWQVQFSSPRRGAVNVEVAYSVPGNTLQAWEFRPPRWVDSLDSASGIWLICKDAPGEVLLENATGYIEGVDLDVPDALMGVAPSTPLVVLLQQARSPSAALVRMETTPFPVADTLVDVGKLDLVIDQDGAMMGKLHLQVRNNRNPYLAVKLPDNASVLSVRVENEPQRWLTGANGLLVPLEKSLQTLDGLVSFPIEIAYVVPGKPLAERWSMAHPVLPQVAAAQWETRIRLPERWEVEEVSGGLRLQSHPQKVVKDLRIGSGFGRGLFRRQSSQENATAATGAEAGIPDAQFYSFNGGAVVATPAGKVSQQAGDLGKNYWGAGYKAYKQGNVEQAKKYLGKALDNDLSGQEAVQASQLLQNLDVVTGKDAGSSDRTRRLRARSITQELGRDNVRLQADQFAQLEEGLAQLDEGNFEKGAELLKQVESLGEQLQQRGDVRRQERLNEQFKSRLAAAEKQVAYSRQTRESAENARQAAQDILLNSKEADRFFGLLTSEAQKSGVAVDRITAHALKIEEELSEGKAAVTDQPLNQVLEGALAQFNEEKNRPGKGNRGISPNSPQSAAVVAGRKTLERRLSKSLPQVQDPFSPDQLPHRVDAELLNTLREQVSENESLLRAYGNTFNPDEVEGQSKVVQFKKQVEDAKRQLIELEEQRSKASQVTVLDTNRTLTDSKKGRWLLNNTGGVASFFNRNYSVSGGAFAGGGQELSVENGEAIQVQNGIFIANNRAGTGEELSEAVQQLVANDGNVSRFESLVLPGNLAGANPFLQERLQSNGGVATLDAAEYQALLESNGRVNQDAILGADSRDIPVGASNKIGGQIVRFNGVANQPDGSRNSWVVNGAEVITRPDQLFCVAVHDKLHFIRSGDVRFWQEEDVAPDWWALPDPQIDLPEWGRTWVLSRTLLGAGEGGNLILEMKR